MNKIKAVLAAIAASVSFGVVASDNELANKEVICKKYAENFIMVSLERADNEFILPLGLESEDCGTEVAAEFKRVRNGRESFQIDGIWMHLYQNDQPYLSVPLDRIEYIGGIKHVSGFGIYLLAVGWNSEHTGMKESSYYSAYTSFEEAALAREALAKAYNRVREWTAEDEAEEVEASQVETVEDTEGQSPKLGEPVDNG